VALSFGQATIEAVFEANEYTITYNVGAGVTSKPENTKAFYDEEVQLGGEPKKVGSSFKYWKFNGEQYSAGQTVKNLTATRGATVEMVAQWEEITYTVVYEIGDGATGKPVDVKVKFVLLRIGLETILVTR
jgi:hypothetical protein